MADRTLIRGTPLLTPELPFDVIIILPNSQLRCTNDAQNCTRQNGRKKKRLLSGTTLRHLTRPSPNFRWLLTVTYRDE